jgi:hypothetical protein
MKKLQQKQIFSSGSKKLETGLHKERNKENGYIVRQGDMAFIRKGDGKITRLGTHGIGPCVGIVVINKKLGHALLGHFDNPRVVMPAVMPFLFQMGRESPIDIYLLSGSPQNLETAQAELKDIIKRNNISVSSFNDLSDRNKFSLEIGVDVTTGQITTENIADDFPPLIMDKYKHFEIQAKSFENTTKLLRRESPKFEPEYPNGNPWALDRAKSGRES